MPKKPIFQVEQSLDKERQTWVYKLTGKLVGGDLCYEFLEEAREKITPETSHVELDIAGVSIINSTGIGIIAALLNSTRGKSGKLVLTGSSESAIRQLKITHLWGFLETGAD